MTIQFGDETNTIIGDNVYTWQIMIKILFENWIRFMALLGQKQTLH